MSRTEPAAVATQAGRSQQQNIELQWHCSRNENFPDDADIRLWAVAALVDTAATQETTIRFVDKTEIAQANREWREKPMPTNVLSFPADYPPEIDIRYLGDLMICPAVLLEESEQQSKPLHAHWAHIVIHGMLHLQGFDHIEEVDAREMESREVEILGTLGYTNPYEILPPESKQS